MATNTIAKILATQKDQPAFGAVVNQLGYQYQQLVLSDKANTPKGEFLQGLFESLQELVPGLKITPQAPPEPFKGPLNVDYVQPEAVE
jgi:hypothetical protein